jgi:hypothetical protein
MLARRIAQDIENEKYTYTAIHYHRLRDKALPLTINATVRLAIEKSKVYILDEDGKAHELRFEKKALKEAARENR